MSRLANLDFKLREELRDELPKLFEGHGRTVVYATSEPIEALLLGVAIVPRCTRAKVTQFGETANVYRAPRDLLTAQVLLRSTDQHRRNYVKTGDSSLCSEMTMSVGPSEKRERRAA